MKLYLQNLEKINEANIDIDAITVISGESDTGINVFKKYLPQFIELFYPFTTELNHLIHLLYLFKKSSMVHGDIKLTEMYKQKIMNYKYEKIYINDLFIKLIYTLYSILDGDDDKFNDIDTLVNSLYSFYERHIHNDFLSNIRNQINNDKESIKIKFKVLEKDFSINYSNLGFNIKGTHPLTTLVEIYKDIDNCGISIIEENEYFVKIKIYDDSHNKSNTKIENSKAIEKINEIFPYNIESYNDTLFYIDSDNNKININNLSPEMKIFATFKHSIIPQLELSNSYQDLIIFNNPENSLHPDLRLILAEIIVLLNVEYGIKFILTTYDPYIMRSIQIFSAKYRIADKSKYYITEKNDDNSDTYNIIDVTCKIDKAYQSLSKPLELLEQIRYSDDLMF